MVEDADFEEYVADFRGHPELRKRILHVLLALPEEVVQDFLGDARFRVMIDNFRPGRGSSVWMACPGAKGSGSRSVVLRPRLDSASEPFALYVIAHEFAHAFLRNGGWRDIQDPEDAADALAADWGFGRPDSTPWG